MASVAAEAAVVFVPVGSTNGIAGYTTAFGKGGGVAVRGRPG